MARVLICVGLMPLLWWRAARRVHPRLCSRRHHVGLRSSWSHVAIGAHAGVRSPVISIWVLLPLAHLHVAHWARRSSVVLLSQPTVGSWWHELLSSFPHASKGILVGLVRAHSAHHFWATHPRLVALRVRSHGVPSGKRRVTAIGKGVLQVHATPDSRHRGHLRVRGGSRGRGLQVSPLRH